MSRTATPSGSPRLRVPERAKWSEPDRVAIRLGVASDATDVVLRLNPKPDGYAVRFAPLVCPRACKVARTGSRRDPAAADSYALVWL